ncbi:Zinc finger protein CONSTANS-LIKE 2, partial [Mucuna pruriens]
MLEAEATATWARTCDTCRSAPSTLFCRAHSAYLCAACDARLHPAAAASWHERVWVCEACERAPAAFLCKADAASLCSSCDADIHSANPLAGRHHRIPVLPISGAGPHADVADDDDDAADVDDEDETASWLLLNPLKSGGVPNNNNNNGFLYSGEVDEYLDLVDNCNSCGDNNHFTATATTTDHYTQHQHFGDVSHQKSYAGDSVVPVQHHHHFQLGLDFDNSKPAFSYNGSVSQSVSVSSMDVGIVPESTMRDVSIGLSRPPKGTIDLFSGPPIQMPSHLTPMDREARVLRYREKKKTRKFEKTIRYASRKAYAETRPRIKGRFAKRTDVEAEVDQMFSTTLITEVGYGIIIWTGKRRA